MPVAELTGASMGGSEGTLHSAATGIGVVPDQCFGKKTLDDRIANAVRLTSDLC
jgi:hypothetical protein